MKKALAAVIATGAKLRLDGVPSAFLLFGRFVRFRLRSCAGVAASGIRNASPGNDSVVSKINHKSVRDFGRWHATDRIRRRKICSHYLALAHFEAEEPEIVLIVLFEGEAAAKVQGWRGINVIDLVELAEFCSRQLPLPGRESGVDRSDPRPHW